MGRFTRAYFQYCSGESLDYWKMSRLRCRTCCSEAARSPLLLWCRYAWLPPGCSDLNIRNACSFATTPLFHTLNYQHNKEISLPPYL